MNLADNLKKIRKDNNLSQEQLAEKLGVSRQSVSKWESNQAYPEMDKVLQICNMFNLNVDELLNQNIKEVKEKKESKNNINKYIDDFLNFITKTIDMFSSMKFKDKVKCLFEQTLIGIVLLILFLIIGSIGSFALGNLFYILPDEIYYLVFGILETLYIMIATIIGIVVLIHIFKVRYLDYYVVVKSNKEDIKEDNNEKKELKLQKEKIYLEKKEKIIIRDPNHSGYKFIKGLLNCVIFIIKAFTIFITLFLLIPLIFLVISLILSFLFIKTGVLFIGTLLAIISTIVINLLVIYALYSFIFSKKVKKNRVALIFISSILIFSLGIGLALISIKDFNYINDTDSKYYTQDEMIVNMNDNLLFDDGYYYHYGYYYFDVEYVETNSNDIKIVCKHSKNYICDINIYNDVIYIHNYQNDTNLMKQLREYINNINDKEIVNYSNYEVIIYTSKENIDKLIENRSNYINQQEINSHQDEINSLYDEIDQKNNTIYELQDRIYELEEEIKEY